MSNGISGVRSQESGGKFKEGGKGGAKEKMRGVQKLTNS
jgi:hypothetical protein